MKNIKPAQGVEFLFNQKTGVETADGADGTDKQQLGNKNGSKSEASAMNETRLISAKSAKSAVLISEFGFKPLPTVYFLMAQRLRRQRTNPSP